MSMCQETAFFPSSSSTHSLAPRHGANECVEEEKEGNPARIPLFPGGLVGLTTVPNKLVGLRTVPKRH